MAEMEMLAAGAESSADNRQMVNAIIASVLGWALDMLEAASSDARPQGVPPSYFQAGDPQ